MEGRGRSCLVFSFNPFSGKYELVRRGWVRKKGDNPPPPPERRSDYEREEKGWSPR